MSVVVAKNRILFVLFHNSDQTKHFPRAHLEVTNFPKNLVEVTSFPKNLAEVTSFPKYLSK
jgi:hypothetical protein